MENLLSTRNSQCCIAESSVYTILIAGQWSLFGVTSHTGDRTPKLPPPPLFHTSPNPHSLPGSSVNLGLYPPTIQNFERSFFSFLPARTTLWSTLRVVINGYLNYV